MPDAGKVDRGALFTYCEVLAWSRPPLKRT